MVPVSCWDQYWLRKYQLRTFFSSKSQKVFWTTGSFLEKCPNMLSAFPGSRASSCQLWSWCSSPTFEQLQYFVSWLTDWKDTQASGRAARWPHRGWAQDCSSAAQEFFLSPEQQLFSCCNHFAFNEGLPLVNSHHRSPEVIAGHFSR